MEIIKVLSQMMSFNTVIIFTPFPHVFKIKRSRKVPDAVFLTDGEIYFICEPTHWGISEKADLVFSVGLTRYLCNRVSKELVPKDVL